MDNARLFSELNAIVPSRLMGVKTALVKLFFDKGYYFDTAAALEAFYDDFTLDNIISAWAGRRVCVYGEAPLYLDGDKRASVDAVIHNQALCCKNEEPSLLGRVYESGLSAQTRRNEGATYTPEAISEYMTALLRRNISLKPGLRLIDPACGCGVFLESFYDALMELYCAEGGDDSILTIHRRLLEECIYGCDTSPEACAVARIVLAMKHRQCVISANIVCGDSLLNRPAAFGDGSFDWVMMNPPYMGHKNISESYKKRLRADYGEVYYEKADLSYCFFALATRLLRGGGYALILSGRYFAQSRFADRLRGCILADYSLRTVIDFYGLRPFKSAGVDPMILFMQKAPPVDNVFSVLKFSAQEEYTLSTPFFREKDMRQMRQSELSCDGFDFIDEEQRAAAGALEKACCHTLGEIGTFFQGVISGCDKAFVVDGGSFFDSRCIDECGVKWIKSSDIGPKGITFRDRYLLYTNGMASPDDIPYTVERLTAYRPALERRRECAAGRRRWFELQWGRRRELFEAPKIVFAYKSDRSCFIYDDSGCFFSADVYGFVPAGNYADEKCARNLAMLLSLPLYDAYFKSFAKKLGGRLYEYYPNRVEKIPVPDAGTVRKLSDPRAAEEYFGAYRSEELREPPFETDGHPGAVE